MVSTEWHGMYSTTDGLYCAVGGEVGMWLDDHMDMHN